MIKAVHLLGNIMQSLGNENEAEKYFIMAEQMALGHSSESSIWKSSLEEDEKVQNLTSKYKIFRSKVGDVITPDDFTSSITSPFTSNLEVTCVSERPLIFRVRGLMTSEECKRIIDKASPLLEKSHVMGGSQSFSRVEGEEVSGSPMTDSTNTDTDTDTVPNNSDPVTASPASVITVSRRKQGTSGMDSPSSPYRKSVNAWLPRDEIAAIMQERLAAATGLPLQLFQQRSEELQVVKYSRHGEFKVHQDSSAFHARFLTALLYLNDVPSGCGGETWFPYAGRSPRSHFNYTIAEAIEKALAFRDQLVHNPTGEPSQCIAECSSAGADTESEARAIAEAAAIAVPIDEGGRGLAVAPVQGDAVIFFNHLPSGEIDPAAVHAGLPLLSASTCSSTSLNLNQEDKTCDNFRTDKEDPVQDGSKRDEEQSGKQGRGDQKWIANYWVDFDQRILFDDEQP
jgi:hypothetical protein